MMEKAHKFGAHDHLVGIASIPDDRASSEGRPAILFLNAGILHRVGPYGLYVDLARTVASDGFFSLRFDLAGIGDSQMTPEIMDYKEKVLSDIRDAMDWMQQKYHAETFVLAGLCSGAVNGYHAAVADARVTGLVMMDGFDYRTRGFYFRHYGPYLKRPAAFVKGMCRVLCRKISQLFRKNEYERQQAAIFTNELPPRQIAAGCFASMAERGVSLLSIYSGGIPYEYNSGKQFLEMFPKVDFKGLLQLEYFADADHTYTAYAQRKKLIACIRQWINDKHGVRHG